MKKPSQTPRGVLVSSKLGFKPTKQVYKQVSKKNNVNTSDNKKEDVEPAIKLIKRLILVDPGVGMWKLVVLVLPVLLKFDKMERLIIEGKVTLVDDEGQLLKKVDSSDDHDSEDEVASVDNDMTNFLASNKDAYGNNSLLEQ
nr:hypothetical protein [Tanacetum cinerariifolium]